MIQIKSQDAAHQYDGKGRAITTWDGPRCTWIVNEEFENEKIDWYGEDSDFPGGMTMKQYNEDYPDYANNPNITVVWTYNTLDELVGTFGDRSYWITNKTVFPFSVTKSWGYFSKKEVPDIKVACERFVDYASFSKGASKIIVYYNEEKCEMVKEKNQWQ